ncbi:unnamed protein product, partial [Ascophyllum nodosum]
MNPSLQALDAFAETFFLHTIEGHNHSRNSSDELVTWRDLDGKFSAQCSSTIALRGRKPAHHFHPAPRRGSSTDYRRRWLDIPRDNRGLSQKVT